MAAAAKRHLATVRILLLAGANATMRNSAGATALHFVSVAGDVEDVAITRLLLDAFALANAAIDGAASDGSTALHFACASENYDVAHALVKAGADPSVVNRDHKQPTDLFKCATIIPNILRSVDSARLSRVVALEARAHALERRVAYLERGAPAASGASCTASGALSGALSSAAEPE